MMCKNNKKILITGVMLAALLAGCGASDTDTAAETTAPVATEAEAVETTTQQTEAETQTEQAETTQAAVSGTLTEDAFQIELNGVVVALGGDMIAYQQDLGEADDSSAAKSCLGTGEDKTFTYGGVTMYTKPIDDMDKIYLIEVTGTEALSTGIQIGSTAADVIAAYGTEYEVEGTEYMYLLGEKTIGFDFENDVVSFIEIFGE